MRVQLRLASCHLLSRPLERSVRNFQENIIFLRICIQSNYYVVKFQLYNFTKIHPQRVSGKYYLREKVIKRQYFQFVVDWGQAEFIESFRNELSFKFDGTKGLFINSNAVGTDSEVQTAFKSIFLRTLFQARLLFHFFSNFHELI